MSQQLRADSVRGSLKLLYQRITERFPNSGLAKVCAELITVADKTARRARSTGQPNPVRGFVVAALIVLMVGASALFMFAPLLGWTDRAPIAFSPDFTLYGLVEALTGLLLVTGGAIFYLSSSGTRAKRRFVFRHLHELRSFAHIIDMHQLTKDPITLSAAATRTASSPERTMTPFELARYLDYCAEMLSHTGKLAALYSEQSNDPEIIGAVNDVEILTANIARKIWQKIMMLDNDVVAMA